MFDCILVSEAKLVIALVILWLIWRWHSKKRPDDLIRGNKIDFIVFDEPLIDPAQRWTYPAGTVQNPSDPSPKQRSQKLTKTAEK